ncbi:MAG: HlyD family secretion protein [Planctomycetales bacterium]
MQSEPVPAAPQTQWPLRPFPASRRKILCFAALAVVASIGATAWIEQVRYERFTGYLQARLRTVTAGREARIARILVAPGQVVTVGQPLAALQDQDLEQRWQACREQVEALELELSRTEARLEVELDIQRRDILDRIFDAKWRSAQVVRQQLQVPAPPYFSSQIVGKWSNGGTTSSHSPVLSRSSGVFDQGTGGIGRRDSDAALLSEKLQEATRTELELCAAHIRDLEQLSRDLPEKIGRSMGVDLARARLEHSRSALAALEQERKELILVAEAAGLVGVFQKQVGDRVGPQEPIVQLLDEEQPYLVLPFQSTRIADFAPGTQVDIRFPDGSKRKGRIEEIPPQTTDLPGEMGTQQPTTITAHIDPVGALWPELPFGSVVEVRRRR